MDTAQLVLNGEPFPDQRMDNGHLSVYQRRPVSLRYHEKQLHFFKRKENKLSVMN